MSTPKIPRTPYAARALAQAVAQRNVSLKIGYSMPKYAAQSRHRMRLYALQARGKTPATLVTT